MTIMASKRKVIVEQEQSSDDEGSVQSSKDVSSEEKECDEPEENEMEDADGNDDSENESDEGDLNANSESDDGESKSNAGWVDSIAKILKTNKPKGKKTLVLSKAKKITDVKAKPKPVGFEIAGTDGTIKENLSSDDESDEDKSEEPSKRRRKDIASVRVKPNILDKDRERTLSKIATKGVVQLFNSVRMQQKDISHKLKEAGPLEVKRDKVLKNIDKRAFLDVLMGEKSEKVDELMKNSAKSTKTKKPMKTEKEKPTWNVLRDDFMMDAKLKDWDKELEQEEENEIEIEEEMECE